MTTMVASSLAIRGDRKALARAIGSVCSFVPAKGTVPIHATVRVEGTARGVLLVTGADFAASSWVEVTVDQCEVESPGLAHVPASQFQEMVASAGAVEGGDKHVTIEEMENGLIIKAKPDKGVGVRYRLGMFADIDDWQGMPAKPEREPTFRLKASDLSEALRLVQNAADDKKNRWLFNAIHFVRAPSGDLRIVASDRKWCSLVDCIGMKAPAAPPKSEKDDGKALADDVMAGAALDPKAVKIVQRLAAGDTSEWSVWIAKDYIQFEGGGSRVACRPLVGTAPPFDAVVAPYECEPDGVDSVAIEFTRRELERVVQAAALVIAPRPDKTAITTAVTFALSGDTEKAPHVAKVRDPDGGESDIGMDVSWSGADYATAYSSEVLPKALKTLPDGDAKTPHVIKGSLHWMRRKIEKGPKAGEPTGSPLVVHYKRSETLRHFLLVMPLDPG